MPTETVVQDTPTRDTFAAPGGDYIIYRMSDAADAMPQWGQSPAQRDRELRIFWPTEPMVASAVYSTVSKYAAFGWSLIGPRKTCAVVQDRFQNFEHGKGWRVWAMKTLVDLFTQDNGGFAEVIRAYDDENAPILALNHLDAAHCTRTGNREYPVTYTDRLGKMHRLKWYDVITFEEFPMPVEEMFDVQLCAISRMLVAARIMRDVATYKREKVSGRFNRAIHLVGGIQKKTLDDALLQHSLNADARNLQSYIQPAIVASIDPTARVTKETLEMASLPDGFDEDIWMRNYITQMAMAFGQDYQDFAPLPAGNLGTSQQSQILHQKSRGKGAALFMRMIEHEFNFHGIMPRTVTFKFGEQDIAEDLQKAQLQTARAARRAAMIASGEITVEMARQIALDEGDLDEDLLAMIGESNVTYDVTVGSSEPAEHAT